MCVPIYLHIYVCIYIHMCIHRHLLRKWLTFKLLGSPYLVVIMKSNDVYIYIERERNVHMYVRMYLSFV